MSQPNNDLALIFQRRAEQAEQREKIAMDTYNGQQQSYRELEALYQASQQRALAAEAELEAARKIVAWARTAAAFTKRAAKGTIDADLAAYDAAVKTRPE